MSRKTLVVAAIAALSMAVLSSVHGAVVQGASESAPIARDAAGIEILGSVGFPGGDNGSSYLAETMSQGLVKAWKEATLRMALHKAIRKIRSNSR